MIPLSLIVITRNAEAHLARCLNSVKFASDVVVLDCGSTDRTLEIARECGARVFSEEWRGFGPQKRRATEIAKYDWVLSLDADEALSMDAQNEVRQILSSGAAPSVQAFRFPRISFHMGRWIRHGGWYPDWQIRLYDRNVANWSDAQIHEKIQAQKIGTLHFPIEHWVFSSLTHQIETNNRYSSLGADELFKKGKRFSFFNLIVKPKVKFFETYVWKLGFLDGLPGFIIAVGAAYSVFLKWAKLWERQRLKPKP